jgi:hypothetical protein
MRTKSVVAQIATAVTVSLIATVIFERFFRTSPRCQTEQPRKVWV